MPDTFRDLMSDADGAIFGVLGETWLIDGHSVVGIFGNQAVESLEMVGTQPVLECQTKHVAFVRVGSTAIRGDGAVYKVVPPMQPDGMGVTRLVLERQ